MHAVASHIPDDYMNRRCRLSNVVERIIAVLAEQHKFLPHLPSARRLQHVRVAEPAHQHDAAEALQRDAPVQQVAHVHVACPSRMRPPVPVSAPGKGATPEGRVCVSADSRMGDMN